MCVSVYVFERICVRAYMCASVYVCERICASAKYEYIKK